MKWPMQRCGRCILPVNYRNIHFNSEGVCNYCQTYESLAPRLNNFTTLSSLFEQRLNNTPGKGEYDCVIGLSGGKDSSWIALRLAKHLNLRCLAVTFDNGFLNDYARNNITLVTHALGIDHFFLTIERASLRHYYRAYVQLLGMPCPGCTYGVLLGLYKIAFEREIPLVVNGRSRSQLFGDLVPGGIDWSLPFLKLNLRPYDLTLNRKIMLNLMSRQEQFIHKSIKNSQYKDALLKKLIVQQSLLCGASTLPEYIGYFVYHPYNEIEMMDQLQAEIGWKRPSSSAILTHSDCAVHEVASSQYMDICGYPLLISELSVLIREGRLTRAEALERLRHVTRPPRLQKDAVDQFCKETLLNRTELVGLNRRLRWWRTLNNWFLHGKNHILRPNLDL